MIRTRSRLRGNASAPSILYYRPIDDTVAKPDGVISYQYTDSYFTVRNDTGAAIASTDVIEIFYKNRVDTASTEYNIPAELICRCSVEYGGTRYLGYTTAGGSTRSLTMAAGGEGILYVTGVSIPAGASFNVWTWSNYALANNHPRGISNNAVINGGTAKAFRSNSDATDYTVSGAPAWSSGTAYCPWLIAIKKSTNPSKIIGIFGDSQLRGSYTSNVSLATIAAKTRGYGFINCAYSGQKVDQANNIVERLSDMIAVGVTDIIVGYPVNDLSTAGITLGDIMADSLAFWTRIRAALPAGGKLIALTCPPRVVDASSPGTPYPTGGFVGGASSVRALYNAELRAKAGTTSSYPTHYWDLADFLESSRDSGLFANPAQDVQSDGLHYTSTAQTNAGAALAAYLESIGV